MAVAVTTRDGSMHGMGEQQVHCNAGCQSQDRTGEARSHAVRWRAVHITLMKCSKQPRSNVAILPCSQQTGPAHRSALKAKSTVSLGVTQIKNLLSKLLFACVKTLCKERGGAPLPGKNY